MREYGSEFYTEEVKRDFLNSFSTFSTVRLLSTGREALGLAAESAGFGGEYVLLPAYSCDSMIQPFIRRGWKVAYYPLNDNFSVNEPVLLDLCIKHVPKAILLMNFFGVAPTGNTVSVIKAFSSEIFIIEDFTHILFSPNAFSNKLVDYYVASIRKWVGIFDGAVLLSNRILDDVKMDINTKFINLRKEGQLLKLKYTFTKDIKLKDKYLNKLKEAELCLDNIPSVHSISDSSYQILNNLDVEKINFIRKTNFSHLYNIIENLPGIELSIGPGKDFLFTPFSMPLLVEKRDKIQKQFSSRGLYAPVLWPISKMGRQICAFSAMMADKMLSVPIDQRYDYDDIEEIGNIIVSVINENN